MAAEYGYHSGDGEGVTDRPMTRAKILAGVPVAPWLAWRRPKRRKASESVTMIEMMMRTMMKSLRKMKMRMTRLIPKRKMTMMLMRKTVRRITSELLRMKKRVRTTAIAQARMRVMQ